MRINHNIAALNTHRQLGANQASSSKNLEKLSSGLKINRAGDDAAGLAISEKMRAQIRGLDMASKNAQDSISLIQTAEGAMNETHSILQRMRELAVQSSNDTNTESDREKLQSEINELTSEINRIGNTTQFNNKNLLTGELSSTFEKTPAVTTPPVSVVVNKAADQTVKVGEEAVAWDNTSKADFDINLGASKADNGFDWEHVDVSAATDLVIEKDGDDFTVSFEGEDKDGNTLKIDAQKVSFDAKTETYSFNNQGIEFSFKSSDVKDWADGDKLTIDLQVKGASGADANLKGAINTVATSQPLTNTAGTGAAGSASTLTDIKVDDTAGLVLDVDKVDVAWDDATNQAVVTLYKGTDKVSETTFSLDATEELNYNADGISFKFTAGAAYGNNDGKASGSFTLKNEAKTVITDPSVVTPAVIEDRSLAFQIGSNKDQTMSLSISDMRASALGITGSGTGFSTGNNVTNGTNNTTTEKALDITSSKNAANAISVLDSAINTVSTERSKLGAVQNRLEHTINNLGTSSENLTAAESRIRDVDMAKEMMEFTKNNILSQAAQAMLAQANQQPQGVLQLLG